MRAVLHDDGTAESGAATLLPVAASRILRGAGLGTGDRVASGRCAERACVSALGFACGATRPFDELADAAAVPVGTHQAVFTWLLQQLEDAGLVQGKTVGIYATTLEANAAMRSIVHRDTGRTIRRF